MLRGKKKKKKNPFALVGTESTMKNFFIIHVAPPTGRCFLREKAKVNSQEHVTSGDYATTCHFNDCSNY